MLPAFHGHYWFSGFSSEFQDFPLLYFKNSPSATCIIPTVQFVPVNTFKRQIFTQICYYFLFEFVSFLINYLYICWLFRTCPVYCLCFFCLYVRCFSYWPFGCWISTFVKRTELNFCYSFRCNFNPVHLCKLHTSQNIVNTQSHAINLSVILPTNRSSY